MTQDTRICITNGLCLVATVAATLGLAYLENGWVIAVGLGPMLGFTWASK